MLESIILIVVALLPALALCLYVFKKDRVEKEPFRLLLGLFVGGVLICFAASDIESVATSINAALFSPFIQEIDGEYYMNDFAYNAYLFTENFFCIALVEEGLKWMVLYGLTRDNKNFNSLFDGIIYSVFVSLGFAAFENILYALSYGWTTALMRIVTAVPAHMFFAVIMGYYYSWWHANKNAKALEDEYKKQGYISSIGTKFNCNAMMVYSIIIPVLIHGFYDFCCSNSTTFWTLAFIALLIFLYIHCFKKIKKMSVQDSMDEQVSVMLVMQKYPGLVESILMASAESDKEDTLDNEISQNSVEENNIEVIENSEDVIGEVAATEVVDETIAEESDTSN